MIHRSPAVLIAALSLAPLLIPAAAHAQMSRDEPAGFERVNRPNSVDIHAEYDTSNATIPLDQVHTLLPRDAIPALTDPELVAIDDASYLSGADRVIVVTVQGETVGVPLKVLNFHEVANMTVGGEPVAATYCPLCDSATVISRRVDLGAGETEVLEFGVSGALYNSNVLMYDRAHKGLWSQLALRAVTGPYAGRELSHLPVRIVTLDALRAAHPGVMIVSDATGHDRPYAGNPYEGYFERDALLVPVASHGDELPAKTLGLGIKADDAAYFVPVDAIGERFVVETELGAVVASASDAGIMVVRAPTGVHTVQSFYYAFSAFHPETEIVTDSQD